MSSVGKGDYVFINCPFDDGYTPLFRGIIFSILRCGFRPRSALENGNNAEDRLPKILAMIDECQLSIHDISNTELDPNTGLPRFNMPFELGLFLGAREYGEGDHSDKACLILDREPYRYRDFLSDIAGKDPSAHGGDVGTAIVCVRDFLSDHIHDGVPVAGSTVRNDFGLFRSDFPRICASYGFEDGEVRYKEYCTIVAEWMKENA